MAGALAGCEMAHDTTLRNRFGKKSFGHGRRQQGENILGACGLSSDSDIAGIAAEIFNVGLNPFERGQRIQKCVIAGIRRGVARLQCRMIPKAHRPQTVVEGDHDHITLIGEESAIQQRQQGPLDTVAATVDPEEYRQIRHIAFGRPDVHVQTILVADNSLRRGGIPVMIDILGAELAERFRFERLCAFIQRLRFFPAKIAHRRFDVGNPLPDDCIGRGIFQAQHQALRGFCRDILAVLSNRFHARSAGR